MIIKGAAFSSCRKYRYSLWRRWDDGPTLSAICLNPSTADENIDDRTVAGMIKRAQNWGYGQFVMLNLFAYRSTDPKALRAVPNPVAAGDSCVVNDTFIMDQATAPGLVICAWGSCSPLIPARAKHVEAMLRESGVKLHYLRLGKTGIPSHPLYLPHALKPTEWIA